MQAACRRQSVSGPFGDGALLRRVAPGRRKAAAGRSWFRRWCRRQGEPQRGAGVCDRQVLARHLPNRLCSVQHHLLGDLLEHQPDTERVRLRPTRLGNGLAALATTMTTALMPVSQQRRADHGIEIVQQTIVARF